MEFATQLDEDEFKELIRSRVLLFLSVDIENSTALKREPTWFGSVAGFLTGFAPEFHAALGRSGGGGESPRLWKAMGDELVFCVEVQRTEHLRSYLTAFLEAVHLNNEDKKPLTPKLKASAWLADFPHGNVIMPLSRENDQKVGRSYDFIGPQMDIGFRLARFATTRRFAISVELAWVALQPNMGFEFFWEGLLPVKGLVEKPGGYPVLWLDTDMSGRKAQRDHGFGRQAGDKKTLRDHCHEHAEKLKEHVRLPMIASGRIKAPAAAKSDEAKVVARYREVITVTQPEAAEIEARHGHLPDAGRVAKEIFARQKGRAAGKSKPR